MQLLQTVTVKGFLFAKFVETVNQLRKKDAGKLKYSPDTIPFEPNFVTHIVRILGCPLSYTEFRLKQKIKDLLAKETKSSSQTPAAGILSRIQIIIHRQQNNQLRVFIINCPKQKIETSVYKTSSFLTKL